MVDCSSVWTLRLVWSSLACSGLIWFGLVCVGVCASVESRHIDIYYVTKSSINILMCIYVKFETHWAYFYNFSMRPRILTRGLWLLESLVFDAFAFMALGGKNFTMHWTLLGMWAEQLRQATVILVLPFHLSTCLTATGYGFLWNLIFRIFCKAFRHIWTPFIHSFIHSECDDSLPFSGASSIPLFPLYYVHFPATLLQQLFFHPLSLHLVIYFLVYLSFMFSPNSYIIPFCELYFLPFSVHAKTNVIYLTLLSLL